MKRLYFVFILFVFSSKGWCEIVTNEQVVLSANFTATFDLKANQLRLFNLPAKEGHNGVVRVTTSQELLFRANCEIPTNPLSAPLRSEQWTYCEDSDSKEWYIVVSSPVDLTQVTLKVERFPTIEINYNEEYMFDQYNATNGYVYFRVRPQANYGHSIGIISNNVSTSQRTAANLIISVFGSSVYDTIDEQPAWFLLAQPEAKSFSIMVTSSETIDLPDVPETVLTVNYAPGDYQAYRYRGGIGKNAALKYKTATRISVNIFGSDWRVFPNDGETRYIHIRNKLLVSQNGTITLSKADFEPGYFNTDMSFECQPGAIHVVEFPYPENTDYVLASQNTTSTRGLWEAGSDVLIVSGNRTNVQLILPTTEYEFCLRVMCANNRTFSARADTIPSYTVKDGDVVTVDLDYNSGFIPVFHGPDNLAAYVDVEGVSPDIITISDYFKPTLTGSTFFDYHRRDYDWVMGVELSEDTTASPTLTFHFKDPVVLSSGVSTYVEGSAEKPVLVKVEQPPSPFYYFVATNATAARYYPFEEDSNIAFALVTEPINVLLTLSAPVEVTSNVTFTVPANNVFWYHLPNTRRSAVLKYVTSQTGVSITYTGSIVDQYGSLDNIEGYILSRNYNDSVDWYFTFKNNEVAFELTLIDQETTILCSTETDPLCSNETSSTSQSSNSDTTISSQSSNSMSDPVLTNVNPPTDEESISAALFQSVSVRTPTLCILLVLILR